jgi:hypothetical protein
MSARKPPGGIVRHAKRSLVERTALSAPRPAVQFPNHSARSARAGTPQRGVPTTIIRHAHSPITFKLIRYPARGLLV